MRLGIFGGTFDPPHLGHLILAAESAAQLSLDRILWVLTPDPPHKQGNKIFPISQRLELVHAVVELDPLFFLSDIELNRQGPHFALDTVNLLRGLYPDDFLAYLIGGDSLTNLPNWYKPAELATACDALGVMRRPGDRVNLLRLEEKIPGITQKVKFIDAPLLDISSTDIRRRIVEERPFRYYLPPVVYDIIIQKEYYK